MKTLQRLNKTIFQMQQVLFVISLSFFTLFAISSCIVTKKGNNNNDYMLLNQILTTAIKQFPDHKITLKSNNSNEYVVEIIKQMKRFTTEGYSTKLDSLKKEIGIHEDSSYEEILNKEQYDYLLYQKQNSNWDYKKIEVRKIYKFEKGKFVSNQVIVQISKPLYTSDNKFAIVSVSKGKSSYISIYKRVGNQWEEYKLFNPMMS